jgi:hypothetical protein
VSATSAFGDTPAFHGRTSNPRYEFVQVRSASLYDQLIVAFGGGWQLGQ